MNTETLVFIMLSATVFIGVFGVYKMMVESKVKALENIEKLGRKEAGTIPLSFSQPRTMDPNAPENQDILKKKKPKDSWQTKLETKLERANILLRVEEFIMVSFVMVFLGALVGFFATGQNILFAILIGVPCYFLPTLYMAVKTMMRMKKAEEQFPEVLDSMVNCFKTGYGFNRSIQVISENYDDPWGTEFAKMSAEIGLGASLEDALFSLGKRMPSPDMDLFITAILIQKETGGNMSELIGNLSHTCRERFKLKRKVSAISAQGKLSAGIVSCVPILLLVIIGVLLPGPVTKFISNPIGIALMVGAFIWMMIGVKVLFKIVQIEV